MSNATTKAAKKKAAAKKVAAAAAKKSNIENVADAVVVDLFSVFRGKTEEEILEALPPELRELLKGMTSLDSGSDNSEEVNSLTERLGDLTTENFELKEAAATAGSSEEVEGLKAEIEALKGKMESMPKGIIEHKKDLDPEKQYVSGPNGIGYVEK